MSKLMIACATLLLGLGAASAQADTLPLPDNLTGFSTHDGEVYFGESDAHEAYFPLASNFLTQKTQAYCGVASMVMVLNALGRARAGRSRIRALPHLHPGQPSERADGRRPAARDPGAARHDADQLGGILATQPVKAEVHHASDSSVDEFRKLAMRLSWRARPFRDRQLFAQGDGRADRRPYFAARRL